MTYVHWRQGEGHERPRGNAMLGLRLQAMTNHSGDEIPLETFSIDSQFSCIQSLYTESPFVMTE